MPLSVPPAPEPIFDAILTPYRSLSGQGFRRLMWVMGTVSLGIGLAFSINGAWPVIGFFGLDVILLYAALKVSFAQRRHYERVTVGREALVIARGEANRAPRFKAIFPAYWARVRLERVDEADPTLLAGSHGRHIAIGTFLSPVERVTLARALEDALIRARTMGPG